MIIKNQLMIIHNLEMILTWPGHCGLRFVHLTGQAGPHGRKLAPSGHGGSPR